MSLLCLIGWHNWKLESVSFGPTGRAWIPRFDAGVKPEGSPVPTEGNSLYSYHYSQYEVATKHCSCKDCDKTKDFILKEATKVLQANYEKSRLR